MYPSDIPPGIGYFTSIFELGKIIYDYDNMKQNINHVGLSETLQLLNNVVIDTLLLLLCV